MLDIHPHSLNKILTLKVYTSIIPLQNPLISHQVVRLFQSNNMRDSFKIGDSQIKTMINKKDTV